MVYFEEFTKIRFYLLNEDIVIAEEIFTISSLKNYYHQEYLKSQGDTEVFINLCLYSWAESYQDWKVATFDVC